MNPGDIYSYSEAPEDLALLLSTPDGKGGVRIAPCRLAAQGEDSFRYVLDELESSGSSKLTSLSVDLRQRSVVSASDLFQHVGTIKPQQLRDLLREMILLDTDMYYKAVHVPSQTAPFIQNQSRVNYAGRVFDAQELQLLVDSALEFYLTAGRFDREFCRQFSSWLSSQPIPEMQALSVNSGSSANLLAIAALRSSKLGNLKLSAGDEVLTVAAGFPTSIAPIIQQDLTPVFCDVQLGTYNIDPDRIEEAITDKTRAIFLAHALGIPFDIEKVLALAEKHNLWVVEDNCDALGAEYTLTRPFTLLEQKTVSGTRKTGTFGHIGTSSFYPAHHITMGEGGAVYTSCAVLQKIMLSLRDWGRDCWCSPGSDETCNNRFAWQLGRLPKGYDHKYTYSHLGFNLKITDMQAAIGLAQLQKVQHFIMSRRENWHRLRDGLNGLADRFILPYYPENSSISPFGFALTVRNDAGFSRDDITRHLESHFIQTRTLFAGNMLRQPALVDTPYRLRIGASKEIITSTLLDEQHYLNLPNSELVMNNTFWVGVYPGMKPGMIDFVIERIHAFVNSI